MAENEIQQHTVLVVDDMLENLTILSQVAERVAARVLQATNGQEALKILDEEPVDLVLLDIMMPGMDGYDVLERIRSMRDMQQLPVILLSALDDTEDIVHGLKIGANDYIPKPSSPRLIKRRIETQLNLLQLSRERERALNIAEHANEVKVRLMRIASHDLKNPLNNLYMVLSMLDHDQAVLPEYLPAMKQSVDMMREIVTEFLDSEVLRDGEISVTLEPVEVDSVLFEVIPTFQHAAEQKGVTILHDITPALIQADRKRLAQVLSNLISNAVKYTYPSTTVYIQGKAEGHDYYIDIIDHGKGINPDEAHKLFQPFSQLSNKPTAGEHSTGLGLWIVKQMVEAQNGQVGVNLENKKGANFWVKFPLAM